MNTLPDTSLTLPFASPLSARQLRRKRRRLAWGMFLTDTTAWLLAFASGIVFLVLSTGLGVASFTGWWLDCGQNQFLAFCLFAGTALLTYWRSGHYRDRSPFWSECADLMRSTVILGLLNGATIMLANMPYSRRVWLASFCCAALFQPALRYLYRRVLLHLGIWQLPAVLIGSGDLAHSSLRALQSERQLGYRLVGCVESDAVANATAPAANLPFCLWPEGQIMQLAQQLEGLHVIFSVEQHATHTGWLEALSQKFLDLHVVPPLAQLPLVSMKTQHFFSHDVLLLRARNNLLDKNAQAVKRLFDIIVSGLLILVLLPLFCVMGLLIKLEGGPVMFSQPRRGRNGHAFPCLKFRTMHTDAEARLQQLLQQDPAVAEEWETYRKLKQDPRITRVGQFLRKTSLDETPQLLNVLAGQMSLIGPRPRLMDEPSCFYYEAVRPGISGLWQVSGRNTLSYEERIILDIWYVRNWNLWYDIAILIKTARVVILREGAY